MTTTTGNAPRRNNKQLAPHVGVGVVQGKLGMFPLDWIAAKCEDCVPCIARCNVVSFDFSGQFKVTSVLWYTDDIYDMNVRIRGAWLHLLAEDIRRCTQQLLINVIILVLC